MPYRAFKKNGSFVLTEIDSTGVTLRTIGAAPDKVALKTLVRDTINAKTSSGVIDFDDQGNVIKDEITGASNG
jgi:hypothetical protein